MDCTIESVFSFGETQFVKLASPKDHGPVARKRNETKRVETKLVSYLLRTLKVMLAQRCLPRWHNWA